jgi:hypothetical protein
MIELTEAQRLSVKAGEAIQVPAPEIGEDVVLLRASRFAHLQELLEDEQEQRAVLNYSMKRAAEVAGENPY